MAKPKDDRILIGKTGEEAACSYLTSKGMKMMAQNWRCRLGEIDIIGKEHNELVFVEVRSRRGTSFGHALESIDSRKQQRLRLVAQQYLQMHSLHDTPLRFDVIAVTFGTSATDPEIRHIRSAF